MVEASIVSLNVAVMICVIDAPMRPSAGTEETTSGTGKPGACSACFSLHPAIKPAIRNARRQIRRTVTLRINLFGNGAHLYSLSTRTPWLKNRASNCRFDKYTWGKKSLQVPCQRKLGFLDVRDGN